MAKVLAVGMDPATSTPTDPALPPGTTAEIVRRGIEDRPAQLHAAGHDARQFYAPADPSRLGTPAEALARNAGDCATTGGGLRLLPRNLALLVAVINIVACAEGPPAIALPARPDGERDSRRPGSRPTPLDGWLPVPKPRCQAPPQP